MITNQSHVIIFRAIRCAALVLLSTRLAMVGTASGATPDQFDDAFGYANKWMTNQNRTFVICMDGTWNTPRHNTNVRRIYEFAEDVASIEPVIPYYDKGVGGTKIQKLTGGYSGHGYQKNVAQAYRFLCMTWKPGDKIIIVGFSRGAYQARLLAGVIDYFGIRVDVRDRPLKNDDEDLENITADLVDLFRTKETAKAAQDLAKEKSTISWAIAPPGSNYGWIKANVDALCVFDTVATIAKPLFIFRRGLFEGFEEVSEHHKTLFPSTLLALHAMAYDEFRKPFKVVPFHDEQTQNRLAQVWFAGAHSDIGGGYKLDPKNCCNKLLSDNSLNWMVRALAERIQNPFTEHAGLNVPEIDATAKRHDEQQTSKMKDKSIYKNRVPRSSVTGSVDHPSISERKQKMYYSPNNPAKREPDIFR